MSADTSCNDCSTDGIAGASHSANTLARDGIILFDALDNEQGSLNVIEGGLAPLGLDPARIKHIAIMHGHADHYGGAK